MTHSQNKAKKQLLIFLLLLAGLLCLSGLISCQTTSSLDLEPFASSDYIRIDTNTYSAYITKIDLDAKDIQLICKIDTENFFELTDFTKQTGAVYAINSTPFFYDENKKAGLLGVTKFNNQLYSEPVEKYSAIGFYFTEDNKLRAQVIKNQTEESLKAFSAAFGGYFTILENGEIPEYKNLKRSRTACGIDSTGRYLYFMCVASDSAFGRTGMSYMECAEILKKQGCLNALQFDGGHSTALICPQAGYVHGKKNRKIPACFGFYLK